MNVIEELILNLNSLPNRKIAGESYFDEMDEMIKSNIEVQSELISGASFPIIASGGFGVILKENNFDVAILAPGSIRGSRKVDFSQQKDLISGNTFTFVDDSYYKGRTLRKILNEITRLGGRIAEVKVVYNDSQDPFVDGLIEKSDLV